MGNLNSGIEDEIEATGTPSDQFEAMIDHIADNHDDNTPPVKVSSISPLEAPDDPEAKIPSDPEFNPVMESFAVASSMFDVLGDIKSKKTICRTDAVTVEEFFGDFLETRFAVEEFSESASGVNFAPAVAFMEDKAGKQLQEVSNHLNSFFDVPVLNASAFHTYLDEVKLPVIKGEVSDIVSDFGADFKEVLDSKNVVVTSNGAFINVLTMPIQDAATADFSETPALAETGISENFVSLNSAIECVPLMQLISAVNCGKPLTVPNPGDYVTLSEMKSELSLKMLADFYLSGGLMSTLDTLSKISGEGVGILKSNKEKFDKIEDKTFRNISEFISTNTPEIKSSFHMLRFAEEVAEMLNILNSNVHVIFKKIGVII